MAQIRKSISIDEGLVFWLENEERQNPEYKGFSDVIEKFLTKGIQEYEREKLASLQIETGRDEQVEEIPPLHRLSEQSDHALDALPYVRGSRR